MPFSGFLQCLSDVLRKFPALLTVKDRGTAHDAILEEKEALEGAGFFLKNGEFTNRLFTFLRYMIECKRELNRV